jgi:hypothetical protein
METMPRASSTQAFNDMLAAVVLADELVAMDVAVGRRPVMGSISEARMPSWRASAYSEGGAS